MAGTLTQLFSQLPGARRDPLPAAKPWLDAIETQAPEHGVDPGIARAILFAESAGGYGRSSAGAEGPWQLTPQSIGVKSLPYTNNPEIATSTAMALIRELMDRYKGNEDAVVAAYNLGWPALNKRGALSSKGLDIGVLPDETKKMLSRYWEMRRD